MRTFLALAFLGILNSFYAQVIIKNNIGPHGGILNVAKNYKIEMTNSPGSVDVYLFDTDMEVVSNKNVRAEIMFVYSSNNTINKTMIACGKNGFTTEVGNQFYFYSIVTFNISGKIVTSKFENQMGLAEDSNKLKKGKND